MRVTDKITIIVTAEKFKRRTVTHVVSWGNKKLLSKMLRKSFNFQLKELLEKIYGKKK